MIAVDTNILVYAHREESPFHSNAYVAVGHLAQGPATWAIPWPCVHEFLNVMTNSRVFAMPTPLNEALTQVLEWTRSPSLALLAETQSYWEILHRILGSSRVTGPQVHDARIVALCLQHAVTELWSADRDFNLFADLKVTNPLT